MAEAARFGISLFEGVPAGEISGNPVQPIVFNAKLITAASAHSQDMISNDYFSHYSLDGSQVRTLGNILPWVHPHSVYFFFTATIQNALTMLSFNS